MYRATARRPSGYGYTADPEAPQGKIEIDTVSCGHCRRILMVPQDVIGGCYQCGSQALCEACTQAEVCLPFEAWLDATEGTPMRGRWAESFQAWMKKRNR